MDKKEELEKRINNLEIKDSLSLDKIYKKKSPNYKKTKEDFAVDYIRHKLTEYDILTEKEIVKLSFPDNYHLLLKLYEKLYDLTCSRYPELKEAALSELNSKKREQEKIQAKHIFLDFRRISQRRSILDDFSAKVKNLEQQERDSKISKHDCRSKKDLLKECKKKQLIEIFADIYDKSVNKAPKFRNEFDKLLEAEMKSAQIPKSSYVHIFS